MQQDGLVFEQWREALGQAQQWHLRPLQHKEAFLLLCSRRESFNLAYSFKYESLILHRINPKGRSFLCVCMSSSLVPALGGGMCGRECNNSPFVLIYSLGARQL